MEVGAARFMGLFGPRHGAETPRRIDTEVGGSEPSGCSTTSPKLLGSTRRVQTPGILEHEAW